MSRGANNFSFSQRKLDFRLRKWTLARENRLQLEKNSLQPEILDISSRSQTIAQEIRLQLEKIRLQLEKIVFSQRKSDFSLRKQTLTREKQALARKIRHYRGQLFLGGPYFRGWADIFREKRVLKNLCSQSFNNILFRDWVGISLGRSLHGSPSHCLCYPILVPSTGHD